MKNEEICMHLGDEYDLFHGAIVPPIYQNTLFTRKNKNHGYSYSRINNPTLEIAEKKLAELERGEEARCFASGMGAISAILTSQLQAGDHVVTLKSIYYPVQSFLKDHLNRFGIQVDFVSGDTKEQIQDEVKDNTKVIYLESPTSNIFKMIDLKGIATWAKGEGIITIVDNTWATPIFQNPLELGVDYVVHSASKYLGGHSDILGGVVVGNKACMDKIRNDERAYYGNMMDPHTAWLLIRSLRTLPIRMKQHEYNTKKVIEFLTTSQYVKAVFYPRGIKDGDKNQLKGGTGLISFILNTSQEESMKFIKSLRYFEEGPSWGGFESVVNTPGIGPTDAFLEQIEVPRGLIRMSIGLESADVLIQDIEGALGQINFE